VLSLYLVLRVNCHLITNKNPKVNSIELLLLLLFKYFLVTLK